MRPKLSADVIMPPPGAPRSTLRSTEPVVCIGASTGGTESLRDVLETLPPDSPGIVVVQHMPEKFTAAFAVRHTDSQRLTGALAPFLSPRPESENDGIEFSAHPGQKVLMPHRAPTVDAPLDQPVRLKALQSRSEHLRRGARLGLKVIEAAAAHEQLPQNEDCPAVPNNRC